MERMKESNAEIIHEFGPFPGADKVHGVSYDGHAVWWASGERLNALDPDSGEILRFIEIPASAGTAFDGRYFYQIAGGRIQKIDSETGAVSSTIPAPSPDGCSGLAWAEGSLWVGEAEAHKIHQLDPQSGKVLRTLHSDRLVTGITWGDGELWHGTWEDDDASDVRRIDPQTGELLERLVMPDGVGVSGLESDGKDRFFCGGGSSGRVRVIRRPQGGSKAAPRQSGRVQSSMRT